MDQRVTDDQTQACENCGGTGLAQEWFGPFFSKVPQEYRELFRKHLRSRHDVFKAIDRRISRQFAKLDEQDSDPGAVLEHLGPHLLEVEEAWAAGDKDHALKSLFTLACAAVWILESEQGK